jgi:hypothetical protein
MSPPAPAARVLPRPPFTRPYPCSGGFWTEISPNLWGPPPRVKTAGPPSDPSSARSPPPHEEGEGTGKRWVCTRRGTRTYLDVGPSGTEAVADCSFSPATPPASTPPPTHRIRRGGGGAKAGGADRARTIPVFGARSQSLPCPGGVPGG